MKYRAIYLTDGQRTVAEIEQDTDARTRPVALVPWFTVLEPKLRPAPKPTLTCCAAGGQPRGGAETRP